MLFYQPKVKLSVFVDDTTAGDGAFRFSYTDLDIEFDVLNQRRSKPNQARITVYNLSEVSRNLFTETGRGVELFAGYDKDEDTKLIFRGTISNVFHEYLAPDWITTIMSGDGQKQFDEVIFNKAYGFGTPVEQIIRDVASAMGLPIEFETDYLDGREILYGESYSSKASNVLDVLTKGYGLEWSVQYGIIEIRQEGQPRKADGTSAVVLSGNTGLIEAPIVTDKGVKVKSLLNHELRPSRVIKIDAKSSTVQFSKEFRKKAPVTTANGIWICDQVKHSGNNFGGSFTTEVESRRIR